MSKVTAGYHTTPAPSNRLVRLRSLGRPPLLDGPSGLLMTQVEPAAPAQPVTRAGSDERLVGVKDLADLLGVSTRWIHERTRRHEIPCYRFGSAFRFSLKEIGGWLSQYRDTPEGGTDR